MKTTQILHYSRKTLPPKKAWKSPGVERHEASRFAFGKKGEKEETKEEKTIEKTKHFL